MDIDQWGHDPQVRFLRRAFSQIEKAQKNLLDKIGISPMDERLRRIRDGALNVFEKAWALSVRRGVSLNEKDFENLYIYSLAYVLERYRIHVPQEILPVDEKAKKIINEATG
ncbi:MAG: hypothetical protein N2596_06170 [Syntrophorhabdaceae bacterium]|nr:hypothetical protein [Syntrophorhabdaceae bacterium]